MFPVLVAGGVTFSRSLDARARCPFFDAALCRSALCFAAAHYVLPQRTKISIHESPDFFQLIWLD